MQYTGKKFKTLKSHVLYKKGEIGKELVNDFPKYDIKLSFGRMNTKLFGKEVSVLRTVYFYKDEVKEIKC